MMYYSGFRFKNADSSFATSLGNGKTRLWIIFLLIWALSPITAQALQATVNAQAPCLLMVAIEDNDSVVKESAITEWALESARRGDPPPLLARTGNNTHYLCFPALKDIPAELAAVSPLLDLSSYPKAAQVVNFISGLEDCVTEGKQGAVDTLPEPVRAYLKGYWSEVFDKGLIYDVPLKQLVGPLNECWESEVSRAPFDPPLTLKGEFSEDKITALWDLAGDFYLEWQKFKSRSSIFGTIAAAGVALGLGSLAWHYLRGSKPSFSRPIAAANASRIFLVQVRSSNHAAGKNSKIFLCGLDMGKIVLGCGALVG
ncbi:MAG: hypothetical protein LBC25_01135 [Holosporales bacterium]|jgi:hypothetical protein|nr:hypothetical protein [Holosporales bacterium]